MARRPSTARPLVTQAREVVGRLRVRCVSATGLAADARLFQWAGTDPYAVLYLRDEHNKQQSPLRRTRIDAKTLSPQWREDFWFAVRKRPDSLALHVDVYDHEPGGKEDLFIGQADLPLDHGLLRESTHSRLAKDLELRSDPSRSSLAASGSVRVEISWEPTLIANGAASARAVAWAMMRSPHVFRVLRVGLLGCSGFLMVVAEHARWLCVGDSFAHCTVKEVPGAGTCAMVGALAALVATAVHFAGSAGLFGAGWRDEQLSLLDLAETELDGDEGSYLDEASQKTMQMQVQSVGVLRWDVSLATALMPKVSLTAMRLLTWLAQVSAAVFGVLAWFLAWLEDGDRTFLAEAVYIDMAAVLFQGAAAWTSHRERRLWAEAERDKWRLEQDMEKASPGPARGLRASMLGAGTGGSGDTPSSAPLNLEDMVQKAQRNITQLTQQAEQLGDKLAQPLLDVRQRLQDQMREMKEGLEQMQQNSGAPQPPEWMQPILEALQVAPRGLSLASSSTPAARADSAGLMWRPLSADRISFGGAGGGMLQPLLAGEGCAVMQRADSEDNIDTGPLERAVRPSNRRHSLEGSISNKSSTENMYTRVTPTEDSAPRERRERTATDDGVVLDNGEEDPRRHRTPSASHLNSTLCFRC